jgi:hypothetical protein
VPIFFGQNVPIFFGQNVPIFFGQNVPIFLICYFGQVSKCAYILDSKFGQNGQYSWTKMGG